MSVGYGKSTKDGSERMRKVEQLIIKSRMACGLSAPGNKELQLMTSAWAEILDPIATDWLEECYLRSMRSLDPSSPYKAAMLLIEWNRVVDSGEFDRSRVGIAGYLSGEKNCDYECSVDGWITVNEAGFLWKGEGHSFAKPCPIHRPQGWQIGDVNQSNYVPYAERMKVGN